MNEKELMLVIVTGVTTGAVMFLVHIGVDLWKNRNNKTSEIKDLLQKLTDSFNLFVSASMSRDGLKGKSTDDFYVKRSSPTELTNSGKKLADESGITNHIEARLESYRDSLSKYDDKTDVLNACRRLALNVLDDSKEQDIKDIRDYFYNEGLSQLVMREIFALKLRDLHFKVS